MLREKKIKEVAFRSLVSSKIPKNRWVELSVFKPYKTEINIQNACQQVYGVLRI